ncbi:MAG: DUF3987 domain-containing protein [Chitinophagales bacterium]|nr:DUF3987 domain-containing protein [Chitinophagales bacterium]
MSKATIFRNFNVPVEDKSLIVITKEIVEGKYRIEVLTIQQLLSEGKTAEAEALKKQLLAFTASATYKGGRRIEHLQEYSGFIVLDIDDLAGEVLQPAFEAASKCEHTFCCFRSPSGNGLKILVEVDSLLEQHSTAFAQVCDYYEQLLKVTIDRSGKDVTRLCFVSFDPLAYRNINNKKFTVDGNAIPQTISSSVPQSETDFYTTFKKQVEFTQKKIQFIEGERNNFVHLLACNCNRAGIPHEIALEFCLKDFPHDENGTRSTFRSTYTNNLNEHGKFVGVANAANANSAKLLTAEEGEHFEDSLKNTPTIPENIYHGLPDILKEGARAFTDKRKRDVFLTGALAIVSGCLPNVTGIYFQERIYPHLFVFIIAPPASGKGVLKNAKRLADKHHDKVLDQSRAAKAEYENDMIEYKTAIRNLENGEQPPEKPEEPSFKIVFIPADCSQARMVEQLQSNGGNGIICETEADTMSGAKKQDWGDYSAILRNAFHHERIAVARKNNVYMEIKEPQLAMALTGTPAQAPKLISSAEDGLFSRFLFYAFKNEAEWQDPSPQGGGIIYNDHFDALADTFLDYIQELELSPTEIKLHQHQWDELNCAFRGILADVTIYTGEDASSIVFRLGLILFRLCMIFTALRKCENAEASEVMYCTDEDFKTALELSKIYLDHSLLMFHNLPHQPEHAQFHSGDNKRKFFEALQHDFTRAQAVSLGTQFKLSTRKVDEIIALSVDKTIRRIKPGFFEKL